MRYYITRISGNDETILRAYDDYDGAYPAFIGYGRRNKVGTICLYYGELNEDGTINERKSTCKVFDPYINWILKGMPKKKKRRRKS